MQKSLQQVILSALNEDIGEGDITSNCLIDKGHTSEFYLIANEDGVLAGLEVFKSVFELIDNTTEIKTQFKNGNPIKKTDTIAKLKGNTLAILKGERTALNFISHLSGIATLTRKLVDLIKHTKAILLDTRKTTPTLRDLEKKGVIAGGGSNHRFNLSEMVLIKDNHINSTFGIKEAILKARKVYDKKFKIEVEVKSISELNEAISCNPDIIMFDNWELKDLKEGLKLLPKHILSEASGQISIDNIKDYAEAGVDYISTSYMIKNARWVDFSLERIN